MTPVAKRVSRRSRVAAVVVLVVVLAMVALTLRLFVYPDLNAPERSSAIVVLGGNGAGPFDTGVALARGHIAPTIVFSLIPSEPVSPRPSTGPRRAPPVLPGQPADHPGRGHVPSPIWRRVHHWDRIIVVMPTTQATRARLRDRTLLPGTGARGRRAQPAGFWAWVRGIVYEWPALVKALVLQPSC